MDGPQFIFEGIWTWSLLGVGKALIRGRRVARDDLGEIHPRLDQAARAVLAVPDDGRARGARAPVEHLMAADVEDRDLARGGAERGLVVDPVGRRGGQE